MFNFRRKTREEITADTFDARFQTRTRKRGLADVLALQKTPAQYERTEIAEHVNFYSAGIGAKNLIVGFGGNSGRLNMAVYMILDALDAEQHDLLLLADLKRSHFDNGIEGYASSMAELMKKVGDFASRRGYSSIITYGTSMGGFPALRGGEMLRANRSIGIGGRFPWHPARLMGRKREMKAFDPLCHCRRPFRSSLYLLYAQGVRKDDRHAAMLMAIEPDCRLIRFPGDDHNFPHVMHRKGRLDMFFAAMFDLTKEPDQEKLIALLH